MTVDDKSPVSKIFSQLGISKSLQRIKFGGVVGKQTLLGVIGAGMLTAIALKVGGQPALVLGGLAAALLILVVVLNYRFADKHTAEATLEGLEMVAYQHQTRASKSEEMPQDAPVIPNPVGSVPQLNPSQEPEQ